MTPASTARLKVQNLSCASCVGRVETALAKAPGVTQASVNLATGLASVTWDAARTDLAGIQSAIEAAGYPVSDVDADTAPDAERSWRTRARLAALLTLPVFLLEMGSHLSPAFHHLVQSTLGPQTNRLIQFAFTALVLAGPGAPFFRQGLRSLWARRPEMNALVALGAGTAFLYSCVATFAPGALPEGQAHIYFEAAAVIVTLILVGRWLEARAKGKAGAAIRALLERRPQTARVRRAEGFEEVPVADLRAGDVFELRPGDLVPTDGTLVEGFGPVDEAMLTGEPLPLEKTPGDPIIGGTQNGTGRLLVEATAVGTDTALARIVQMVEEAQGTKLPIQAMVDRITGWFVPAIIAIAAVTFGLWLAFGPGLGLALVAAVSVLIIACPCAMGLATPTSIMVGSGRAAQAGILFRKGDALERLAGVRLIAFDKTGTLTEGRPTLTHFEVTGPLPAPRARQIIAALEAQSEHPIARALTQPTPLEATGVTAHPGGGITGRCDGMDVTIGSAEFLDRQGIDTAPLAGQADAFAQTGATPVFFGFDGQLAGLAVVADRLKDSAKATVAALQARGILCAMITGDIPASARAVATALGIETVVAGVKPDGKVAALKALAQTHGALAFVGDGINDAPALASADVGIALGTGTDVAVESADVIVMADTLQGVVRARDLSQATLRNIRQNLFWAFAYNTALIPVAAGVLYPALGLLLSPMLGAGAMAASSVLVVLNALRLRRWRPAS